MIENETKLTLTQATKHWPGRPHTSTLWRACRKGTLAANGERVFLEHRRFGSRIYTSHEAIERFAQRLTAADAEHFRAQRESVRPRPARGRSPETRATEIAAARAELVEENF